MRFKNIFRLRKILWFRLLLLSVIGVFTYNIFAYAENEEDWMPDAALPAVVRETLELSENVPLTKEKMQELVSLDANRRNIVDITGLEFATNLIELHIGQNAITDLRPLANLTQLVELHFWHFPLNPTNLDLGPLANLINLEVLSLEGHGISDVTPLAGLKRLRILHLTSNHIEDVTPLAGLTNLQGLWIQHNWAGDLSPLLSLNLIDFHYDKVCDFIPLADSVESRIKNRNFPSIVGMWPEGEESTKYDFHYGSFFDLFWGPTRTEPFGLRTELSGGIEQAKAIHQQLLQRNPNILFLREVRIHNHLPSNNTAFPVDSDFWLRDGEGKIVQNSNGEYMMNLLNPDLQDLLIERIVGFSECGIFDGILLDGFGGDASFGDWFAYELIIKARIRILREVRERVRDDFLIMVNANRKKPVQYAEYVNGSAMEPGEDYKGTAGGTYKLLQVLDETLLWNEENLRQPTVNWAQGFLLPDQPPDSADNQRRMRLFTARGLTHSDGYVSVAYAAGSWKKWMNTHNFWYDFWDIDLGQPVGEKGQRYENREGLFIREFTNGWAVYNRSGQAQTISLPQETTGVASGVQDIHHTIPDLDGEIYLKSTGNVADLNGDGIINILDLVIVANALGETEPDLNSDGVVNIQDLVIVANAFGNP